MDVFAMVYLNWECLISVISLFGEPPTRTEKMLLKVDEVNFRLVLL
jgi:hypothetical protein